MQAKLKVLNTALGVLGLVALLISPAAAAPKGVIEAGKMLFKFNVLSRPNAWEGGGNACNGARIFFTESAQGSGTMGQINWTLDPTVHNFTITDCYGQDGVASVVASESVDFIVAIRVLGPKNSALNFACSEINATLSPGEDLCVIDTGTIKKGNAFTRVMQNVADNELEYVLWSFSGDWKIFDVRVYEWRR